MCSIECGPPGFAEIGGRGAHICHLLKRPSGRRGHGRDMWPDFPQTGMRIDVSCLRGPCGGQPYRDSQMKTSGEMRLLGSMCSSRNVSRETCKDMKGRVTIALRAGIGILSCMPENIWMMSGSWPPRACPKQLGTSMVGILRCIVLWGILKELSRNKLVQA